MADEVLGDSQHATLTLTPGPDAAGNPGLPFDAGSVTAALADGTELTAVVQPDGTILVTALGPLTAVGVADALTVNATSGGVAVTGTFPMDTTAEAAGSISGSWSAPVAN